MTHGAPLQHSPTGMIRLVKSKNFRSTASSSGEGAIFCCSWPYAPDGLTTFTCPEGTEMRSKLDCSMMSRGVFSPSPVPSKPWRCSNRAPLSAHPQRLRREKFFHRTHRFGPTLTRGFKRTVYAALQAILARRRARTPPASALACLTGDGDLFAASIVTGFAARHALACLVTSTAA
jgi:hypothetical protein